jgi:8-oxo-dGTP pyrophosphatase MutT (NUDIX family)
VTHPFDWQLVKSEYIVQDRWLSLRADTCQLPNGRMVAPYYIFEYPTWVNVVALTQDHHVVLVRQYRHGVQQTVLELPSGTVEATDISPLAAIQRELLEETGYTGAVVVETGRLSPNAANHANWTYCFLATGVEQVAEPVPEEAECVETVLMPLADVVRLASQGGLWQALHVGALFLALHTLGRPLVQ